MGSVPVAGETAFGPWLKARRKTLDLTQRDLAQRVGCTAITIRKFEAGERRPSKQVAERLAGCLEIPLDEQPAFVQFARTSPPRDETPPEAGAPVAEPVITVPAEPAAPAILAGPPPAEAPLAPPPGGAGETVLDLVPVPAAPVPRAPVAAVAPLAAGRTAPAGMALAGAPPGLLAPAGHYHPDRKSVV